MIYFIILQLVFIKANKPSLYSFQGSLPSLPLPSVKDTILCYLRSVRPLLDDENYQRVKSEARDFENGLGKKLQRYLWLKWLWSSNYVSDWWEEYVYLRGRSPLMINSNFGGPDTFQVPSNKQTARAANFLFLLMQHRRNIKKQKMKPIMGQGLIPLCMWQYERTFNTVRVPGVEVDKIVHYENIDHAIVLHKGCYYKVFVQKNGRLYNALEIQSQLDRIIKIGSQGSHGEKFLASLTSMDRKKWALAREKYFSSGVNKASLREVESGAIVMILEEREYVHFAPPPPGYLFDYHGESLHGKVHDRWFDKSVNLAFGTNGKVRENLRKRLTRVDQKFPNFFTVFCNIRTFLG